MLTSEGIPAHKTRRLVSQRLGGLLGTPTGIAARMYRFECTAPAQNAQNRCIDLAEDTF